MVAESAIESPGFPVVFRVRVLFFDACQKNAIKPLTGWALSLYKPASRDAVRVTKKWLGAVSFFSEAVMGLAWFWLGLDLLSVLDCSLTLLIVGKGYAGGGLAVWV